MSKCLKTQWEFSWNTLNSSCLDNIKLGIIDEIFISLILFSLIKDIERWLNQIRDQFQIRFRSTTTAIQMKLGFCRKSNFYGFILLPWKFLNEIVGSVFYRSIPKSSLISWISQFTSGDTPPVASLIVSVNLEILLVDPFSNPFLTYLACAEA